MKKIIIILLISTTLMFANIGKITAIKGSATILRDNQKITAVLGLNLKEKDTIQTASNARLQIVFKDNTIVSIGKNSQFDISTYINDIKKPQVEFKFGQGVFKTITGAIGKSNPEKFKLKTKSSTIGIRGTIVGIESTTVEDTIIVPEGKVEITTDTATIEVNAGEMTRVVPGQIPTIEKIPVEIQNKIETQSGATQNEQESGQGEATKTTSQNVEPISNSEATLESTSDLSDEQRVLQEQQKIDEENARIAQDNIDNAKKDAQRVAEEIERIAQETEENNLAEQARFEEERRLESLTLHDNNTEYIEYQFGSDITDTSVVKSSPSSDINLTGFSQGGKALSLSLTSSTTSLDIDDEDLISNFLGNYTTAKYINNDKFAIVSDDFWFATQNNDTNDEFDILWGYWGDKSDTQNNPKVWVAGVQHTGSIADLILNVGTSTPYYQGHLIGTVTHNGQNHEILSENSTFQMQMDLGKSINDRVTVINVIAPYGDSSQNVNFSNWNVTGQGSVDANGKISFDSQSINGGTLNLKGAFYKDGHQIGGTLDYTKGSDKIDAAFRAKQ